MADFWRWFRKERKQAGALPLYLHNTRTNAKEEFSLPQWVKTVRMYNCGPTVYGTQHIGNLSMFVFTDILRRVLAYNGFVVRQVINFTDVGHLVSDADEGEDKMTKGLKREGLTPTLENMRALGEKYAAQFLEDIGKLNIDTAQITFPRASDYIPAQIAMVKTLEEKGYTYRTSRGVYFDTSRFPSYGLLGGIDLEGQKAGARVAADPEKRNPTDFLLWKLDLPGGKKKKLGWDSSWGKGFPGWHIECSAMVHETLGKQIDIHTGGIEHIPVHHNNEIAQSEAATGKKPFSRFWLHRAHLQLGGQKFAKSEDRVILLADIIEKGFHPLALRYLLLGAHYRTPANFTWEALGAAETALERIHTNFKNAEEGGEISASYQKSFHERINDDLDTPGALAVLWEMLKDDSLSPADKRATLLDFDRVLGLGLGAHTEEAAQGLDTLVKEELTLRNLPEDIQAKINEREEARKNKDWASADALRGELAEKGFVVEDTPTGVRVSKG